MPPGDSWRHLLREHRDGTEKEFGMTASRKQQSDLFDRGTVRIEPWGEGDLPLLKKLLGDPAMTEHLGGPESDEQLVNRQARYARLTQEGHHHMLQIATTSTDQ